MGIIRFLQNNSERARTSLSSIIKIILILSVAYTIYSHLWRILFINLLLLFLIFIPTLMKRIKIKIPTEFEIILFLFVLVSFILGDIRGLVIQVFFGLALGFVGFTLMLILYANSKMKTNYFLVVLFSICFSIALGFLAEMTKYYLKIYSGQGISLGDYTYAMTSLTFVAGGAIIASILGLIYMKTKHRYILIDKFVDRFKNKNPNLFIQKTDSPEELLEVIKKGENEKLEFKSTLRINIHTNEFDKNVEKATLKTVTALLNTGGGSLLIGVSNSGEISGIEKDKFSDDDRFRLHFTNLIKEHIGNQYLPYLTSELIEIKGKGVLKVDCLKSPKPVFLKVGKIEEFYVRNGPASIQLIGSKLVDYIKNNFDS